MERVSYEKCETHGLNARVCRGGTGVCATVCGFCDKCQHKRAYGWSAPNCESDCTPCKTPVPVVIGRFNRPLKSPCSMHLEEYKRRRTVRIAQRMAFLERRNQARLERKEKQRDAFNQVPSKVVTQWYKKVRCRECLQCGRKRLRSAYDSYCGPCTKEIDAFNSWKN